ncbi:hypothetical protein NEOLEDRAFT_1152826 [Neolentinus lepideus HHB14362 ss-1]|uniref:Uncharacterized protein n=1 Tax=Neolentinus lepideus HHB14362 ss-1 TaxID=1314782 RepID=A0A165M8S1_9AGAM|nr:hypothetical protein NEOLEDRAFT_1152826 [Neolentinus lepideus HHB14362 ss-1]
MPDNPSGMATVQQPNPKTPPILTPGDLTPAILRKWHEACRVYAMHRELDADKQVSRVAWGMQDDRMADWYRSDQERIDKLSLSAYIDEMKTLYLRHDWEEDLRDEILNSTQGDGLFWDWVNRVQSMNALLKGTVSHFTDVTLRFHFEAHIHPDTKRYCRKETKNLKALDFKSWINAVRLLDEERVHDKKKQTDAINDALRRQGQRPRAQVQSSTTTASVPPRSNTNAANNTRLPALTEAERALLMKYSGCFGCRKFGVNHRHANCSERPDPTGYKTLSEADVPPHLKAPGSMAATSHAPRPVAAVNTATVEEVVEDDAPPRPVAVVMPSCILGDGSDSEPELLDNGAHMLLLSPTCVPIFFSVDLSSHIIILFSITRTAPV